MRLRRTNVAIPSILNLIVKNISLPFRIERLWVQVSDRAPFLRIEKWFRSRALIVIAFSWFVAVIAGRALSLR